jgi:hypothetical protein
MGEVLKALGGKRVMTNTIYIAGPITGVPNYWEAFEWAEEMVTGLGYTALTPSRLPHGISNAQAMRICFAMIDSADVVLFLPGWDNSEGAQLEYLYCEYIKKPYVHMVARQNGQPVPEGVTRAWLQHNLEEVLGS